MNKLFLILLLCVLYFSSCEKSKSIETYYGYEYFPSLVSKWISYDVIQITWNDYTNMIDTSIYQLKELSESEIIDNAGRKSIRIERYIKTDTSNWVLNNVWTKCLTLTSAEKIEENIRFIKMKFPIDINTRWNGNEYNNLKEQMYFYKNIFTPFVLNENTFDSTITVINQDDFIPLYSKDFESEVFAKNIGLVYKKQIHIKLNTNGIITSGKEITYKMNT